MRRARLHGQDGFIREVLWLFFVIAVIAVVVLDSLALYNAYRSVRDDATTAAEEAHREYSQSLDAAAAEAAAKAYLSRSGLEFLDFSISTAFSGEPKFSVTAKTHADTYVFKYLRYLGLKKWVLRMTDPQATSSTS